MLKQSTLKRVWILLFFRVLKKFTSILKLLLVLNFNSFEEIAYEPGKWSCFLDLNDFGEKNWSAFSSFIPWPQGFGSDENDLNRLALKLDFDSEETLNEITSPGRTDNRLQ